MGRRFETFYRIVRGTNLGDILTWNKRFEDIDRRISSNEDKLENLDDVAERVESVALDRINQTVLPLTTQAQNRLREVARVFEATSASTETLALGTRTFIIPAGERDTFAHLAWCYAFPAGTPGSGMVGAVVDYDVATGTLELSVSKVWGTTGGSYSAWKLGTAMAPELIEGLEADVATQVQAGINAALAVTDVGTETAARVAADNALQGQISAEVTARGTAISSEASTRANADSAEANARATADGQLQTAIDKRLDFQGEAESTIPSAATCDIGGVNAGRVVINGTTTIASFGAGQNKIRFIRFAASLTLTNGANLILPGGANIVTRAGDTAIAISDASAVWRVRGYQRADGSPATPLPLGQCRFTYKTGTTFQLMPENGNKLFINGEWLTIPDAGVTLDANGLTVNRFYYVYSYKNGSGAIQLEASTTGRAVAAGTGHAIKSGDVTRSLVGAFFWNGDLSKQGQWTLSWYNRKSFVSTGGFLETFTTSTTVNVEVGTRAYLSVWAEDVIQLSMNGYAGGVVGYVSPAVAWAPVDSNGVVGSFSAIDSTLGSVNSGGDYWGALHVSVPFRPVTDGFFAFNTLGVMNGTGTANFRTVLWHVSNR